MAMTAASMGSSGETPGGIIKARSMPVITALPSFIVISRPSIFWLAASTATQLITETAVIRSV